MKEPAFVVLLVLTLSAGCMQTEPPGERSVGLEYGTVLNESQEGYVFTSSVYGVAHRTTDRSYENVTVKAYSNERDLIASKDVGTITTGNRSTVQLTLEDRPEYVLIVSPAFWDDSDLDVFGLAHKEDGIYEEYTITERNRFSPE